MDSNWWSESEVTGYDFENDESSMGVSLNSLQGATRLSQKIKDGLSGLPSPFDSSVLDKGTSKETSVKLNLCNLLSDKSLNAILEADNCTNPIFEVSDNDKDELRNLRRRELSRWNPPDIERTLKNAFLGQSHSFELYKSHASKQELLNAAEKLGDGDIIIEVVIFLSKTLKQSLFQRIIRNSPLAAQHYIAYLTKRNAEELENTLMMLGRNNEAGIRQFEVMVQNRQRLENVQNCYKNHFDMSKDKNFVLNYINLLIWQNENVNKKLMNESIASTLSVLCSDYWHEAKGTKLSPLTFAQSFAVCDKLYDWIAFNSRAKKGCWLDISNYFIIKGWLGGPKLKTDLPPEHLVIQLNKLSAPPDVIQLYIQFIDPIEKRTELAKKFKLHKVAIDGYCTMKDRLGLLNYQAHLFNHSEDYSYADKILNTSGIKWKN